MHRQIERLAELQGKLEDRAAFLDNKGMEMLANRLRNEVDFAFFLREHLMAQIVRCKAAINVAEIVGYVPWATDFEDKVADMYGYVLRDFEAKCRRYHTA
jgi:hypothetical protein